LDIERESQKKVSMTTSSSTSSGKHEESKVRINSTESSTEGGSQDSFDFSAPQRKDVPKKSAESDAKSMHSELDVRYWSFSLL
jgi:hypothetical protein